MVRYLALLALLLVMAVDLSQAVSDTLGRENISRRKQSVLHPCTTEFLLLEFTTAEPVATIRGYFFGIKVVHAFKVYGAGHYFLVIENDQSEALKNLTLPADASVNATSFPIETANNFLFRFRIPFTRLNATMTLSDDNLVFVERIWNTKELNEEQYQAALAKHAANILASVDMINPVNFVAVAELETKFIFFWNEDNCGLTDLFHTLDTLGEPGCVTFRVLRIFNLP